MYSPDELHDSVTKELLQIAEEGENLRARVLAHPALRHLLPPFQQPLQLIFLTLGDGRWV